MTAKATVISNAFLSTIHATITNTTSSKSTTSTTSTASSTTSGTVADDCEREAQGSLQLRFYVSAENVTREIYGLPGAQRRLQSTPCSATDGVSVGFLQCHAVPVYSVEAVPCHKACQNTSDTWHTMKRKDSSAPNFGQNGLACKQLIAVTHI